MGRGFHGAVAMDAQGQLEPVLSISASHASQEDGIFVDGRKRAATNAPEPASYMAMFLDQKTLVLCLTGWSFHFANANVLLVLGELMSGNRSNNEDDDTLDYEGPSRSAIPLIAGAIVLAQLTMSLATIVGDKLTGKGVGRKPLFMAGLLTLPIRCALVIWWQKWGDAWLLSTQILDGVCFYLEIMNSSSTLRQVNSSLKTYIFSRLAGRRFFRTTASFYHS
jgi:MFS family permease